VAAKEYGLSFGDVEKLTLNAMKSAFISFQERLDLIYNVIKPGFADLRADIESAATE
jgi:adenosine deaminase